MEADGAWHLSAMKKIVCYRVWDNRIFQFNAAKEFSTLFDRVLVADPPLSKEDAEWQIWLHEGGAGHAETCASEINCLELR